MIFKKITVNFDFDKMTNIQGTFQNRKYDTVNWAKGVLFLLYIESVRVLRNIAETYFAV